LACPGHSYPVRRSAGLALGADLAGDPGDLGGERGQLVDHRVHGRLELQDLALRVDVDLAGEVAAGDRGRHLRDVADLVREVPRHGVDVVGEVLPDAGHALHLGPPAPLAPGAHFAGHAGDLVGEGRELDDHGAEGVIELQDLALAVK